MDDWRIINQEYFLKGVELKKIKFPEFWKESYLAKNDFYEMISKDAFAFVFPLCGRTYRLWRLHQCSVVKNNGNTSERKMI